MRIFPILMVLLACTAAPGAVRAGGLGERVEEVARIGAVEGIGIDGGAFRDLYAARDSRAIWTNEADVAALIATLAGSDADGLDPRRYRIAQIKRGHAGEQGELLLTAAALAYAEDMTRGQIDPLEVDDDYLVRLPPLDPARALALAVANGQIQAWLASLAPRQDQYRAMKDALARYRDLAASGGWHKVGAGPKLEPGMSDPRVPALRRRLAAEGDLGQGAISEDPLYDESLVQAVAQFQTRNGLTIDAKIGPRTLAALDVPAAERARQIALNLERWRWMGRAMPPDRLEVNTADATLSVMVADRADLVIRAVVGDPKHPSPLLTASVRAVVLNPTWTVPSSIIRNEIGPKLARDPNYLEKENIRILESGAYRQDPGPTNALGRIKFDMPNKLDVYMHDTPSRKAFGRAARAQSHGCVRLEQPETLALRLLADDPKWTRGSIARVIDALETTRVPLAKAVPVVFTYWTAFVDGDGRIQFRDDIYGRDRRLAEALAHPRDEFRPIQPQLEGDAQARIEAGPTSPLATDASAPASAGPSAVQPVAATIGLQATPRP